MRLGREKLYRYGDAFVAITKFGDYDTDLSVDVYYDEDAVRRQAVSLSLILSGGSLLQTDHVSLNSKNIPAAQILSAILKEFIAE